MKNVYLQAMGITAWRLRSCSYHLLDPEQKIIGTLIASVYSPQEYELLEAIRRALPVVTHAGQWDGNSSLLILSTDVPSNTPPERIICTHSLADMLENPKLKAVVWKDIKNFMSSLSLSSLLPKSSLE